MASVFLGQVTHTSADTAEALRPQQANEQRNELRPEERFAQTQTLDAAVGCEGGDLERGFFGAKKRS